METAHSIICTVDPAGIITFINDYGATFFGYTREELVGEDIMVIIPDIESSGRQFTPLIRDILSYPDRHAVSLNENFTKDGRRV